MPWWNSVPRGKNFFLIFKVNTVRFFILFSKSTTWKRPFSPTWQFYSNSYSWFAPPGSWGRKSWLLHQQHQRYVTCCCIQEPNVLNFWTAERTGNSNRGWGLRGLLFTLRDIWVNHSSCLGARGLRKWVGERSGYTEAQTEAQKTVQTSTILKVY